MPTCILKRSGGLPVSTLCPIPAESPFTSAQLPADAAHPNPAIALPQMKMGKEGGILTIPRHRPITEPPILLPPGFPLESVSEPGSLGSILLRPPDAASLPTQSKIGPSEVRRRRSARPPHLALERAMFTETITALGSIHTKLAAGTAKRLGNGLKFSRANARHRRKLTVA